jgi:hypothetical protein
MSTKSVGTNQSAASAVETMPPVRTTNPRNRYLIKVAVLAIITPSIFTHFYPSELYLNYT